LLLLGQVTYCSGFFFFCCAAEEVLDGDNRYACDGCRQRCRAARSTRFEVAPNSLVLCLKRFGTGRFGKINKVRLFG
jgi:ubiquitin carboxyl-terminal hydrolase 36/42